MNRPITLDDIYALFRESEQQRQEYQQAFEERQRASELERKQQQQAFEERQRASQQAFEERQRASELERKQQQQAFEERMASIQKTIDQTNKQMGGLTTRWGEFVENLIKPTAARIFKERGIDVHLTALRVNGQDEQGSIEVDILVENTTEVVAIEVKSHLEVRDVKRFLQTLERFKKVFPKRKNDKLYGAVAGIKVDERANEYAVQEGLFLIQPAGDSVIIANSDNFKPKFW